MPVEREFLQLDVWDQLQSAEVQRIALTLLQDLGSQWELYANMICKQEQHQRHVIELLNQEDSCIYCLIPGGYAELGIPIDFLEQIPKHWYSQWQHTEIEIGFPPLDQFLAERLTPNRRVNIQPMLMQQDTFIQSDVPTLEDLLKHWQKLGMRLPTADEWEYASGGGCQTLWRWGNELPRTVVFDYGRGEAGRGRNAFGLYIGGRSSGTEWVGPPWEIRGGDGEESSIGDYGELCVWLTRSIRYRPLTPDSQGFDAKSKPFQFADVRRVLPLGEYLA